MDQAELNRLDLPAFMTRFGALFEHSPWIVERAYARRPWTSLSDLHGSMVAVVKEASRDEQLALLRAHPELAGREAEADTLTQDSRREQKSAGLDRLSRDELTQLRALNLAYRQRHGFPFIIAVRLRTKDQIFAELQARISNDVATELATALDEVGKITRLRLEALFAASAYPRDLVGYGANPPHPRWPNNARLALSFVLNYEEGGENCVLHGDPASETFLSEIIAAQAFSARHLSMESLYEYGSRAGVWRILRMFRERQMPLTMFAVAMALQRHPDVAAAAIAEGHEICSHGYRWISYQGVDEQTEREHIRRAVEILTRLCGKPPVGWYTGRDSVNTRRLVVEHGGFLYDSDSYADDLPYFVPVAGAQHLVIPYTLDVNDMRFATAQGFNSGEQFFTYLKDSFDVLYAEGKTSPKMMSVGLHCRIVGRPGRAAALMRFLDYVAGFGESVWICRREDIARHFLAQAGALPSSTP